MKLKSVKSCLPVLCYMLVILFSGAGWAYPENDIDIKAQVNSSKVVMGQQFEYIVTITGKNLEDGIIPRIPGLGQDFEVISSSQQRTLIGGSSFSITINNKTVTQNEEAIETLTVSYILEPKTVGPFTIGPPEVPIQGTIYQGNKVKVVVSQRMAQSEDNVSAKGDYFIVAEPSRSKVYVGQEVDIKFTLYIIQSMDPRIAGTEKPKMDGFWVEEWDMPDRYHARTVIFNEVPYYAVDMARVSAFPISFGTKTVGEFTLNLEVVVSTGRRRRGFSMFESRRPLTVKSEPITINVIPLPEKGKPATFSDLVGNFQASSKVDRNELAANETLKLTITVTSEGNIKGFKEPALELPDTVEKYDPEVEEKVFFNGQSMTGTKTFNYLLIPREQGDITIGPARVNYFDPEAGVYKVAETEQISVRVGKGSKNVYRPETAKEETTEIKMLNRDIRYIKPDVASLPDETQRDAKLKTMSAGFWALGVIVIALSVVTGRRRERLEKDPKFKKFHTAHKRTIQALNSTRSGKDAQKTVQNISEALYEYLSDKLNIQARSMTRDQLAGTFRENGLDDELSGKLLELMEQCDALSFSSTSETSTKDLSRLISDAKKLTGNIEKKVKWNGSR